jgi:hypothetical protein
MQVLRDYHHFKTKQIDGSDGVARCERHVIDLLLGSTLSEDDRDSSVAFELKHHAAVTQFARLLARKRAMPEAVCTVGALLHDIYVITHGRYQDHAHRGAPIADRIAEEVGNFGPADRRAIHSIVHDHSDKHVWSDDAFAEFGKDVDVLDCFLYPGAFEYYLLHKSLPAFKEYLARAKAVWAELGIPSDPRFELLSTFAPGWLDCRVTRTEADAAEAIGALCSATQPPPYAVVNNGDGFTLAVSSAAWRACDLGTWPPQGGAALSPSEAETAAEIVSSVRRPGGAAVVWPALGRVELIDADAPDRLDALGLGDLALDVGAAR